MYSCLLPLLLVVVFDFCSAAGSGGTCVDSGQQRDSAVDQWISDGNTPRDLQEGDPINSATSAQVGQSSGRNCGVGRNLLWLLSVNSCTVAVKQLVKQYRKVNATVESTSIFFESIIICYQSSHHRVQLPRTKPSAQKDGHRTCWYHCVVSRGQ